MGDIRRWKLEPVIFIKFVILHAIWYLSLQQYEIRGWYHNFTQDYNHIFKDKRNILNGLRCEAIIEQGRHSNHGPDICPCDKKEYQTCSFLQQYRNNLENIDFNEMYNDMLELAENYKQTENIEEEIILVLIVYETSSNPCSERKPLQDFFNAHGIECKELEYPIQKFKIKEGDFKF